MIKKKLGNLTSSHLVIFALAVGGSTLSRERSYEPEEEDLRAAAGAPELTAALKELALHWAPAIYQDTDSSHYVGDYLTHFNFDGDYEGKNNWENLEGRTTVPAYVYYAVSETETHWFLNYSVFHPQDWHEWNPLDRHENDVEGVSLAIEKGPGFGRLVAMATLAHDVFYQYGNHPGLTSGVEKLRGPVTFLDGSHPRVFSEAKGHGLYGCDGRCDSAPGGDGILYVPGDHAASPAGGDGNYTRQVRYALIAMDADGAADGNQGFWYRRDDICDTCTFGSWGRLRGDNYGTDRAKMPWVWTSDESGPVAAGAMLCDPAFFFDAHLNGAPFDDFSHVYVAHPFRTHELSAEYSKRRPSTQSPSLAAAFSFRPSVFTRSGTATSNSYCRPSARSPEPESAGNRVSALSSKRASPSHTVTR
jgi:hypothetical protein